MKIKNYLFIKAGEALLVIVILILFLTIKTHGQVISSKLFSNDMVLYSNVCLNFEDCSERCQFICTKNI